MLKQGIAVALGFLMAAPAMADDRVKDEVETRAKNTRDDMKTAGDTVKDKVEGDTPAKKRKRHAKKQGRKMKKKARNTGKDIRNTGRDIKDDVKR